MNLSMRMKIYSRLLVNFSMWHFFSDQCDRFVIGQFTLSVPYLGFIWQLEKLGGLSVEKGFYRMWHKLSPLKRNIVNEQRVLSKRIHYGAFMYLR
jgi:hypothetical protein